MAGISSPDHPRSRGVYHFSSPFCVGPVGSSPLARGLLECPATRYFNYRIIPARAGFTGVLTLAVRAR